MTRYGSLSVIIPAYNEEATIEEIIRRVKQADVGQLEKEIVVVDDGSQDRTREILQGLEGIRLFCHEKNRGKGAAIKTGIRNATGDILLIQDGDLEYNPEDYPVVTKPILEGRCEFVIGSRFQKERPRFFTRSGDPFVSHYIGNLMIIWLTNFLYGQSITDCEGCYKAFTKSLAQSIPVRANSFQFDNELMCKSLRRGYKILEVPIRYAPRLYMEGKKIRWQHGVMMLWTILKWRFLSF